MSAKNKNLSEQKSGLSFKNASRYRIAIVVSDYNDNITFALRNGAVATLKQYGVKEKHIFIQYVPGAFELPLAAKWMYRAKKADAVICLGCVIKGDTDHDVYINHSVSKAIMQLNLETQSPFVFGLLTPNTLQQAKDRAGGKHGNKGVECAMAALKMLDLKDAVKTK